MPPYIEIANRGRTKADERRSDIKNDDGERLGDLFGTGVRRLGGGKLRAFAVRNRRTDGGGHFRTLCPRPAYLNGTNGGEICRFRSPMILRQKFPLTTDEVAIDGYSLSGGDQGRDRLFRVVGISMTFRALSRLTTFPS